MPAAGCWLLRCPGFGQCAELLLLCAELLAMEQLAQQAFQFTPFFFFLSGQHLVRLGAHQAASTRRPLLRRERLHFHCYSCCCC